jgi:hypothetical protein
MLPDFPQSRRELFQKYRLRIALAAQAKTPVHALGAPITQHEGNLHTYDQLTQSGVRTVTEGFKEIAVPIEVKIDEIPGLTAEKVSERLDAIAEDVARQTSQIFYRMLDETTHNAGTAIDAGGQPPSKDVWLEMFQRMEMSFDPKTGKPEIVFITHPVMAEVWRKSWTEWEKDPAFMKQYREILAAKREAWRDRESRRKLVD